MRRALLLSLLLAACGNNNNGGCNNNMKEQYRTGAQCASDSSCPPGQICAAGNICYATCTSPGFQNSMMNSCCECCGFSAPNSGQSSNCDLDLFCKPGCNPGGSGATGCNAGSCTGGQICDTMYNICRTTCSTTNPCPSGQECVSAFDGTNTCNYCRPKGGAGTVGQPCNSSGSSCNTGLTCDPVSNTCLYTCGQGGMNCGGGTGPNCPANYGCDASKNICRPLCQGNVCPSGMGGTCMQAGVCQLCIPSSGGATTIATTTGANHIAVDNNDVYWTTNNDVRRCPLTGCVSSGIQVAVTSSAPVGIAVGNGFVYWNTNGIAVQYCGTGQTCNATPMTLVQRNEVGGGGIAAGNGSVLFSTGSGLYLCPASAPCNSPTRVANGGQEWLAFNMTDFNYYFFDVFNIDKVPNGSSTAMTIGMAQPGPAPRAIAAYENDILLVTDSNIERCSVGGCAGGATLVTSGRSNPHGIVSDGTNFYWTEQGSGQIMKCTFAQGCRSGDMLIVTSGQNSPYDIAVDANFVYWTSMGDGTVKKIHK